MRPMMGMTSAMASRLIIIEPSRAISASRSCGGTRSGRTAAALLFVATVVIGAGLPADFVRHHGVPLITLAGFLANHPDLDLTPQIAGETYVQDRKSTRL